MNVTAESILRDRVALAARRQNIPQAPSLARKFLAEPSHATGADLLIEAADGHIVYEKLHDKAGRFYERTQGGFYKSIDDMLVQASKILDAAVERAFQEALNTVQGDALKTLYVQTGIAKKKARTRDFVSGVLTFFSERVMVSDLAGYWNTTPECLSTLSGVLDFSGDAIVIRQPRESEYFRDPIPVRAEDVTKEDVPAAFSLFLMDVFPDPEVRRTATECLSLGVSGRGSRTFQIWFGEIGSNGKNTLIDCMREVLPGYVGVVSPSVITRGQDSGARRFGAAELAGLTLAAVDEVSGSFDVAEIKRLSGGSIISIERKGEDAIEVPQTWALVALTNHLPTFYPPTDAAFLQRLVIVPFHTTFYFNETQRDEYLRLGVPESCLKPAEDREELLATIRRESPAIIGYLIREYIKVRVGGGRPYECAESRKLKREYQAVNDLTAEFFLEYLERDPQGKVEYSRLLELWKNHFGDKMATTREVIKRLTERFGFIEKRLAHGTRYLAGITERQEKGPEDAGNDNSLASFSSSLGNWGTEKRENNSDIGKTLKIPREMESPFLRSPVPLNTPSEPSSGAKSGPVEELDIF